MAKISLRQNPFSPYDFLGYFVPGALFICLVSYLFLFEFGTHVPSLNCVQITEGKNCIELYGFKLYIPFILISYLIGHLISYLSSLTIEKYSVWKDGYPSKYLLRIKSGGLCNIKRFKCPRIILRIGVMLFLLPILVWDFILGYIFKFNRLYVKSLDSLTINLIKKKIDGIFKEILKGNKLKYEEYNFFNIIYHYAVENCPTHYSKFQNYVALYGFQRACCLLLTALFWLSVIHWKFCSHQIPDHVNIWAILIISVSSYFFYLGFVKFYRRFNLEVLLAISILRPNNLLKPMSPRKRDATA